jgi:hypothetical protein
MLARALTEPFQNLDGHLLPPIGLIRVYGSAAKAASPLTKLQLGRGASNVPGKCHEPFYPAPFSGVPL